MRRRQFIRNKHSLGRRASLKSLRRYCIEIWAELVKTRDNHKCIFCGKDTYVQAHHIITVKYVPTRFDINCGLSLCAKHHELGFVSARNTPWIIYEWIEKNRPEQYKWFIENRDGIKSYNGMKVDIQYYRNILKDLLNEFEKFAPQVIKKCKYTPFTEIEENEICNNYLVKLLSRRDLAVKYGTNEQVIETILRRKNIKMRNVGTRSTAFLEAKYELNGINDEVE